MKTGSQPRGSVDGGRPDAAAYVDGWAPMARNLPTVAGILDDLPYPAHLHAVDDDRTYPWVAVNAAALAVLGATRDDVIGRPLADVIDDRTAVAVMGDRRIEVVARLEPVKFELAVDLPTGHRRFDATLVPIHNQGGRCSHIFVIWNDTTEVRESESRLRTAAESGDKGFSILDSVRDDRGRVVDFRFVYANRNTQQRLGRSEDEIVGHVLSQLVPARGLTARMEWMADVVETGKVFDVEFPDELFGAPAAVADLA
ncbi:MAG: PAS domain-containing protein [Acidimicrobiia bacterium]